MNTCCAVRSVGAAVVAAFLAVQPVLAQQSAATVGPERETTTAGVPLARALGIAGRIQDRNPIGRPPVATS